MEPFFEAGRPKRRVKEYKFTPYKIVKLQPTGNQRKDLACPKPRSGHRIVVKGGNVYAFGGYNPASDDNDWQHTDTVLFKELWKYNCASKTWKLLDTSGNMPDELASHCAVLLDNVMLVFGGTGVPFGDSSSNSTHVCNLDTLKWSKLETTGSPPERQYGQAMALHNDKIYVVGGTTGYAYSMKVHCLDLQTKQWELLEKKFDELEPPPRYRHEIALEGDKIFVFGGGTAFQSFDFQKVPVFDLSTQTWSKVQTSPECPKARRCHGCVQMGSDVYICGGHDGAVIFSDIWRFNLVSFQWTKLRDKLPTSVYFHSAALSDKGQLFVFGGVNSISDNTRTNELYSMWLKIPSLADMCWQAVLNYIPKLSQMNKMKLYEAGIPARYINEVDFDSTPYIPPTRQCCTRIQQS